MSARTRSGKFLALLLVAWLALAPSVGLAQDAPSDTALAAPAGPAVGEPRIRASDIVNKFGDPVTIILENDPGLQEGNFIAQMVGVEFNCGGTWRTQCTTPLRIDRNGNASIQARVNSAAIKPVNVIFNFRRRDNSILPASDLPFATAEVLSDWGDMIKLRARVVNQGTSASWPTTLVVLQDSAADAVASRTSPMLAPGESHSLVLPWAHGMLTAGLHNVEIVVNADDFDEVDRTNNRAGLRIPVGADLALSPFNIDIDDRNLAQTPVTVTVVNAGAAASANATLTLHNSPMRDAAATLITYPLPSLEAGEVIAARLTVPGSLLCGVYANIAAPDGDIDPLNNYASVAGISECSTRVFLPQAWR